MTTDYVDPKVLLVKKLSTSSKSGTLEMGKKKKINPVWPFLSLTFSPHRSPPCRVGVASVE